MALVGALCTAPITAPGAPEPRGPMGINAQVLMQQRPSGRRLDRHLDAMQRGGIQVVRTDATWAAVEPVPPKRGRVHHYEWGRLDSWVGRMATRGIRWLPVIVYSVGWSTETPRHAHGPPADDDHYAAFAAALADRYGTDGTYWRRNPRVPPVPVTAYEVWNEPNLRTFWGGRKPDAKRYAALFLTARRALKRADPNGRVIVGGLAGRTGAPTYLRRMYRARPGLRGRVDGVGLHLYSPTAEGIYERAKAMRAALDTADSPSVPLEVTEIGWVARTPAEEGRRTELLQRVARELPGSACRIGMFLPHTWSTPERDRRDPQQWFGLVGADTAPKPSGQAYLDVIRDPVRTWQPIGPAPCA
jgi:hypothetical protein